MLRFNLRKSVGLRIFIVGVTSFILMLPAELIQSLISEREVRRDEAIGELSQKWGRSQLVSGPVLTVPYKVITKNDKGVETSSDLRHEYILPETYMVNADMKPQVRYRGIYEVVLYSAGVRMEGNFKLPRINGAHEILWNEAYLTLGISDLKGLRENIKIRWNDSLLTANPGAEVNAGINSGVTMNPHITPGAENYSFAFDLSLDGSSDLQFIPVGKQTTVKIKSNWGNPSFTGEYLPDSRQVDSESFAAQWKVLYLNRNFPQQWSEGHTHQLATAAFGVKLMVPVDEYQKTMRTAKYAIMFIMLTFLSFFMIELLNKKALHPVQYLLIGFALSIFYVLLLSISEHFSFGYAYLFSSIAVIMLITLYTKSVLKSALATSIIAVVLSALYGFLYIILQLQDYALLAGSFGLFAVLALIMYITRKIDWFALSHADGSEGDNSDPDPEPDHGFNFQKRI